MGSTLDILLRKHVTKWEKNFLLQYINIYIYMYLRDSFDNMFVARNTCDY